MKRLTPDKSTFTLSSPSKFTPGKFASGMLPEYINQRFSVSITNNSGADLDIATLIVRGETAEGSCMDIFDGDNGMAGAPTTPIAAGASQTFAWGLSCPGKSGEDLKVVLSNAGVDIIQANGKIA